MGISIQQDGRRSYFAGNTYPVKDLLRDAGAHWDADRKMWWTGKSAEAEAILAKLTSTGQQRAQAEREAGISEDAEVIRGRCQVPNAEGKPVTYYVLASGTSAEGRPYMKLAFRDGSKVFWAKDPSKAQSVKMYRQPTSIRSLKAFAERKAREAAGGDCECWCHTSAQCTCGQSFCHFHHDGCDSCGCER